MDGHVEIEINRAELGRAANVFIDRLVASGEYESPEAVVLAALEHMLMSPQEQSETALRSEAAELFASIAAAAAPATASSPEADPPIDAADELDLTS